MYAAVASLSVILSILCVLVKRWAARAWDKARRGVAAAKRGSGGSVHLRCACFHGVGCAEAVSAALEYARLGWVVLLCPADPGDAAEAAALRALAVACDSVCVAGAEARVAGAPASGPRPPVAVVDRLYVSEAAAERAFDPARGVGGGGAAGVFPALSPESGAVLRVEGGGVVVFFFTDNEAALAGPARAGAGGVNGASLAEALRAAHRIVSVAAFVRAAHEAGEAAGPAAYMYHTFPSGGGSGVGGEDASLLVASAARQAKARHRRSGVRSVVPYVSQAIAAEATLSVAALDLEYFVFVSAVPSLRDAAWGVRCALRGGRRTTRARKAVRTAPAADAQQRRGRKSPPPAVRSPDEGGASPTPMTPPPLRAAAADAGCDDDVVCPLEPHVFSSDSVGAAAPALLLTPRSAATALLSRIRSSGGGQLSPTPPDDDRGGSVARRRQQGGLLAGGGGGGGGGGPPHLPSVGGGGAAPPLQQPAPPAALTHHRRARRESVGGDAGAAAAATRTNPRGRSRTPEVGPPLATMAGAAADVVFVEPSLPSFLDVSPTTLPPPPPLGRGDASAEKAAATVPPPAVAAAAVAGGGAGAARRRGVRTAAAAAAVPEAKGRILNVYVSNKAGPAMEALLEALVGGGGVRGFGAEAFRDVSGAAGARNEVSAARSRSGNLPTVDVLLEDRQVAEVVVRNWGKSESLIRHTTKSNSAAAAASSVPSQRPILVNAFTALRCCCSKMLFHSRHLGVLSTPAHPPHAGPAAVVQACGGLWTDGRHPAHSALLGAVAHAAEASGLCRSTHVRVWSPAFLAAGACSLPLTLVLLPLFGGGAAAHAAAANAAAAAAAANTSNAGEEVAAAAAAAAARDGAAQTCTADVHGRTLRMLEVLVAQGGFEEVLVWGPGAGGAAQVKSLFAVFEAYRDRPDKGLVVQVPVDGGGEGAAATRSWEVSAVVTPQIGVVMRHWTAGSAAGERREVALNGHVSEEAKQRAEGVVAAVLAGSRSQMPPAQLAHPRATRCFGTLAFSLQVVQPSRHLMLTDIRPLASTHPLITADLLDIVRDTFSVP